MSIIDQNAILSHPLRIVPHGGTNNLIMKYIKNLTLIGCLFLISSLGQYSHAAVSVCNAWDEVKNCEVSSFATNGHSFWLPGLNGVSSDFHFAAGTGTFKEYSGGRAKMSGTLVNENDPTQKWTVMLWLAHKSDWDSWSNGGTGMIHTGLGSGMYTVTVTDGGCSVEDSAEIIVPEPLELSFIATSQSYPGAGDGTLQAVVLGGTPAYSYSWQTGATTATLGGIVYGWFNVTVTDANGCMISDSGYVTPGAIGKTAKSTSTEATDIADISFTAFPNPTVKGSSVWMAIENVMLDEKTTVQLYDLTGQLILSEQHSIVKGSNKVELNGSRELSAGSYIIRLNAGDQVITSRILVSN
ncbi:MAG TPA: hypothetical protein DCX14_03150 [Flavobacteriales bacterium]|nr:hypothetical protein [Flavobacteriales bacterium]